jgi:ATP-dependent Lon protease
MSKTKILNLDMMSLQNIDEDSDLIPLMTSDDEEAISKELLPKSLPILPLKNTVMFPGVVIPITASRDKSIKLIKESNTNSKLIGVVSQKDSTVQNPGLDDIQSTGTVAKILRVLQMPDGNVTIIIQGKKTIFY